MTGAPSIQPVAACPAMVAAKILAKEGGREARGAFSTRIEIVNFILDLAGYTADKLLHELRVLEPSCGTGSFLFAIIERLVTSWQTARPNGSALKDLSNAIKAVELHEETFINTRLSVINFLKQKKFTAKTAIALADRWILQGDFLLTPLEGEFNFVVGNPPYIRQELIPAPLAAKYRSLYQTFYDRADIYVPFIERSLSLLSKDGHLGFICPDRWMKNRYGGPLRKFVAEQFHLKIYVDMVDTSAFHSKVTAYPAITIFSREKTTTRTSHRPITTPENLARLVKLLSAPRLPRDTKLVHELVTVTNGNEPWLLESTEKITIIRRIESAFPLLEETGCMVGIGVATGADKVFIGDFETIDVEPDRKLPLATTKDIASGEIVWLGQGVVNPFTDSGELVDLNKYPRLQRYLSIHKKIIKTRHCAQKNPLQWYRTIDRITPSLLTKPKLLIPDIKGEAHVVFEQGQLYPHHNLYYVTSENWDIRALQAVLLSSITRLFVATYSTKLRGESLRFQAQYLRRIRIPHWSEVPSLLRRELISAAIKRDIHACNHAAFKLYGLNKAEISALDGNGE